MNLRCHPEQYGNFYCRKLLIKVNTWVNQDFCTFLFGTLSFLDISITINIAMINNVNAIKIEIWKTPKWYKTQETITNKHKRIRAILWCHFFCGAGKGLLTFSIGVSFHITIVEAISSSTWRGNVYIWLMYIIFSIPTVKNVTTKNTVLHFQSVFAR